MFKKIAIALIVGGMVFVGSTAFTGLTAQAAAGCGRFDSATLAANPELKAFRCGKPSAQMVKPALRTTGLQQAAGSTYLAANPELSVANRYRTAGQPASSYLPNNPELMLHWR